MSGAMLGAAFFRMLRLGRERAVAAKDAAEAAACDVVPWEEAWNADDAAVEAEEGRGLFAGKDEAPADDGTLASRYAKFNGESLETPLYTGKSELVLEPDAKVEAELCRVLGRAFSHTIGYANGSDMRTSADLIQAIADESNYKIEEVKSVMNRAQYNMHRQFGLCYGVVDSQTVYHGTKKVCVNSILRTGLRGAANQRRKVGCGTYVTPDPFHAAAYAEPGPNDGKQHVLVVQLMTGPTGLGSPNQVCSLLRCLACVLGS
jgi:hypothetical protein